MRTPANTLLATIAAAAALSGCGGDGGADTSGETVEQVKLGAPVEVNGTAAEPPYDQVKLRLVVDVEEGVAEDLKDFNLEPEERAGTPYYVTRKVTNLDKPVTGGVGVASPTAFDDHEVPLKEITLLSDFPKCESGRAPETFATGASYSDCAVYIAEKGSKLVRLQHTEPRFDGPNVKYVWPVG